MQTFGKYELVHKIGSGGMAEIYLARSFGAEGLEKILVLKRIRPEFAERPKFVAMFIDEAKIAVSLNHPNIVQVYEFGRVASDYFLAMEHVDGTDLGRMLAASRAKQRTVPIADALYVCIEVAKALDYAHRKQDAYARPLGIVHRDVSPQNVLISRDGGVKLLDFGIAKAAIGSVESPGEVKGKLSYMSPEQARGLEVDHRSDLFSLGVVLWELLANRSLFPFTTQEETLRLVKNAVVPPYLRDREDLPPELLELIDRALAANAAERFQSARDLQVALTRCLFSMGTIADSMTLTTFLAGVEDQLPLPAGSPTPATLVADGVPMAHPSVRSAYDGGTRQSMDSTAVFHVSPGSMVGFDTSNAIDSDLATAGGTDPGTGEPPAEVLRRAERTESVIVCGDVRGFSALRGATGNERWRQVLLDYIRIVESIAYKNSALVDRIGEGGFTLLLGLPFSAENDAERAVELSQQLHEALDAMNINLQSPLSLSIGVLQGNVVVEHLGHGIDGRRFNWSWDEATAGNGGLYLAEALAHAAMGREVLMGGRIFRRIRRRYRAEEVQTVDVDVDDTTITLAAHRLQGPLSGREVLTKLRHSYVRLVGRDIAIQNMRDTFRAAVMRGVTQGLLVTGEQGVGKSSLMHEFLVGISGQGAYATRVRVVRGMAPLHDKDTAYASLMHITQELLGLSEEADLRQARERLRWMERTLLAGLPALEARFVMHALAFLLGVKVEDNVMDQLDVEERRQRLTASVRTFLRCLTTTSPVVFALEDLHNVDPSSIEFLADVLDSQLEASAFFLMTSLSVDEATADAPWRKLLAARGLVVEPLGELDPGSARELAIAILPESLATDDDVVGRVVQRAGGNPLYLKEMVELLVDRNLTDPREVRRLLDSPDQEPMWIPTTVEGLVTSRIDRLAPAPKQMLQRCGLLGFRFNGSLMKAICSDSAQGGAITNLFTFARSLEHLDVLVVEGFLRRMDVTADETEPGDDREPEGKVWAFRNALIMEIAARGVVEPERGELHHRIAEHLLARSDDVLKVEFAEVGRHLDAAGLPERAGEMYLLAAEAAIDSVGGDECVRLVDKALGRVDPDGESFRSGLELKERALAILGQPERRKAILEQLLALLDRKDVTLRRKLRTRLRMVRLLYDNGELDRVEELATEVLAEARVIDDSYSIGSALRLLVMVYRDTGRRELALEVIEEAVSRFEMIGDIEGLWAALVSRGITLRQGGRSQEALETYKRALEIIEGKPYKRQEQTTLINMGLLYANLGELDQSLRNYNRALQSIRALGHTRDEGALLANMGHLYLLMGDCDRAQTTLIRSIRLTRRTNDKLALADALITLGVVHLDRGRLRQADAMLRKGLQLSREIRNVYLETHAILALTESRLAEGGESAVRDALMLAEEARHKGVQASLTWASARGASLAAEGYSRLGDPETARRLSTLAVSHLASGTVDGAEHVLLRHAELLATVDPAASTAARAEARRLVEERRDRIADPIVRRTFLRSSAVRRVLEG